MSSGEKVIKEDWFRKRGGKGANITTQVGNGKRKYFVLTEKYLDWYEMPKGHRKGSLALDNIYVRQQPENSLLVIGQYGRPNEFKITYEGPNPRDELQKWYDAISKAIDDFKKKKVNTADENFKLVVDKGTEREGDYIDGFNKKETFTTTTVTQNNPPPQNPPIVQQTIVNPPPMVQQQTFVNPQPPMVQQTFVNPPPPIVQQQTFVTPPLVNPNPVIQTTTYGGGGFYQPPNVYNPYQPQVMQTNYFSPYGQTTVTTGAMTMCQFCRNTFSAVPGTIVRCPYCQQVNGGVQQTTVSYGMPPYY